MVLISEKHIHTDTHIYIPPSLHTLCFLYLKQKSFEDDKLNFGLCWRVKLRSVMWNLVFPKLSSSMHLSMLVSSEHLEASHHLAVSAAFVPLWRVLVTYCGHAIRCVISITGVTMSFGRQTGLLPTETSPCPVQALWRVWDFTWHGSSQGSLPLFHGC